MVTVRVEFDNSTLFPRLLSEYIKTVYKKNLGSDDVSPGSDDVSTCSC